MENALAERPKILIVDDDALTLEALNQTLQREGYQILQASDGSAAIKIIEKEKIALLICDQHMPGISGLEVLKKALSLQPDAIRIVLTGVSDLKIVEKLINEAQVYQFIVKPWDHMALLQTVHASIEKFNLVHENRRLQELTLAQHLELEKNHEDLLKEVRLGGRIQEILLLGKIPQISGLYINAISLPSTDIDGDFFDFFQPSQELLDVVIGDVMGKGLPAALIGTAVKTQLSRFAIPYTPVHTYEKRAGWHRDILSPKEIAQSLHREMSKSLIELDYFVSLFYGRFHLRRRLFTFIDCGATKPLHYRNSLNKAVPISGNNFPLGFVEKEIYQINEIPFADQDLFVFYSDGVTEARSPNGELYGVERLIKLIETHAKGDEDRLVSIIKQSVTAFTNKESFDDDLTIIVIKISAINKLPHLLPINSAKFISDLSQLKAVRDFVHRFCLNAPGNAQRLSDDLQLAINEAFCNIVEHGYRGNTLGEITIKGEYTEEGIVFDIADGGQSFNPAQIQEPSLVGDRDRGFGLYMIKEIADRLEYVTKESEGGLNHLCILKHYFSEEDLMDIIHHTENDVLIISVEGENLDAKEAPIFKQKVIDLIAETKMHRVVLDLHQLNFIDSSGLGSFLSLLRALNTRGGDLKIAGMTKPIRTIFELVCMHKIFEIYNSTEEALHSFNGKFSSGV